MTLGFKNVAEMTRFSNTMLHFPGPPSCNCSEFQCPPRRRYGCRTMTINDPCGCCSQCGKPKGQVCGGPSWRYGNCERGLICALTVGLHTVTAPLLGVCKGNTTAVTYIGMKKVFGHFSHTYKCLNFTALENNLSNWVAFILKKNCHDPKVIGAD